ncbi:hypothetical protein E2320_000222, partial [Naja naja]
KQHASFRFPQPQPISHTTGAEISSRQKLHDRNRKLSLQVPPSLSLNKPMFLFPLWDNCVIHHMPHLQNML